MLNRRHRLIKRGSFSYVYKQGNRVSVSFANSIKLAYVKSKGLRIGFSVGTKVGCAVKRNLVKRRMRHAVAQILPKIPKTYQMVFICFEGAYQLSFCQIKKTVEGLLVKSKII